MSGMPHISRLPEELMADIFLRLPLREVARARLVCKQWHSLTTEHHFLNTCFSRHAAHSVDGFFSNYYFRRQASHYLPLLAADADAEAATGRLGPVDLSFIPSTYAANPGTGRLQVVSACHGLLLASCWLRNGRAYCCVCNPLTKKVIPIGMPAGSVASVVLAFDPSKSQHYKIIWLGAMDSIHVYTSETRSWGMAIHPDHSTRLFQGLCPIRGIYWDGSIVWIVAHSLVRFVIEGEHLGMMPMPPRKQGWICSYIGESAGHLQMIGYTKKDKLTACFDILEIQGGQSEWSVLYHVDLNRVKELYPDIERPTWDSRCSPQKIMDYLALSPIYVIQGMGMTGKHGVLIFSIPGKIMSYNMDNQEISIIKEIESTQSPLEYYWYHFYAYSNSLFTL